MELTSGKSKILIGHIYIYHYRQEKVYEETVAIGDLYMKNEEYDEAEEGT